MTRIIVINRNNRNEHSTITTTRMFVKNYSVLLGNVAIFMPMPRSIDHKSFNNLIVSGNSINYQPPLIVQ